MKKRETYFGRRMVGAVAVLLLTTPAWAVTQADFDKAVACCWMGLDAYVYCDTPVACATGAAYCQSKKVFIPLGYPNGNMKCSSLGQRGENDDAMQLFVPPAPAKTEDGETLEVSSSVAKSLRTATQVMQLQSRGASSEELKAAVGDDVELGIQDADEGERVITIRGEGADDLVLRFDSDGKLKQKSEEE